MERSEPQQPSRLVLWWWQRRIGNMKRCRTTTELARRFGAPASKRQDDDISIWHYPLAVAGEWQYAIHVVFDADRLRQVYIATEPAAFKANGKATSQARAKLCRLLAVISVGFVAAALIMTIGLWLIAWHDGSVNYLMRHNWSLQGSSGPWGRHYNLGGIYSHATFNAFIGLLISGSIPSIDARERLPIITAICGFILLVLLVCHLPLFD